MSDLIKEINVEEIVKKPKSSKPRMSKIVSKAVLLKQISDSKLIPTPTLPPGACSETVAQAPGGSDLRTDEIAVTGTAYAGGTSETLRPTPKKIVSKKVKKVVEIITPSVSCVVGEGTPLGITVLITSYKCDLCNTVFTSKVLYERHPRTIRHKTNLIKEFEAVNK